MTPRVTVVTAVALDTPRGRRPGVLNHVERKLTLLRKAGFEVNHHNIGMVRRSATFSAIPRLLRGHANATYYVRLSARTAAVVFALGAFRRPLILEVNGILDRFLPSPIRRPARWIFRRLGRRSSVVVVGDRSWMEYSSDLFGSHYRFVELPLTPAVSRIQPAKHTRTVVFAGAITKYQGLDVLIAAWAIARREGWALVLHGEGPLADEVNRLAAAEDSVHVRSMLTGDDYLTRLATAGVLVGHYPGEGLPVYRRSMLKTCDYAVTDRPFVTNDLDTLLDDLPGISHGVLIWNRQDPESLAVEISKAIDLAEAGEAWPERWKQLAAKRGDEIQVAALRHAVASVQ